MHARQITPIPHTWCIAAGTQIETPEGPKPIESLEVGDHVLSVDPNTGERFTTSLTFVRSAERNAFVMYLDGGRELRVTDEQLVYSPPHEDYTYARHWRTGELDEVMLSSDEGVESRPLVGIRYLSGESHVYEVGVDHPLHNLVANGVLVHDKQPPA